MSSPRGMEYRPPAPLKLERKRVSPRKQGYVETDVPKVPGAFIVRQTFTNKSALDFPDLPVFTSMGPGTSEYRTTTTIMPIDVPHQDLVKTMNHKQRKLVADYQHAATDFGGPLQSPRMSTPSGPQRPMTTNSLILDGTLRSLRSSSPLSARDRDAVTLNTLLPSLFGGGRTKAQHRHLQAVNRQGERLKGPGPAPPSSRQSVTAGLLSAGPGSPMSLPPSTPYDPNQQRGESHFQSKVLRSEGGKPIKGPSSSTPANSTPITTTTTTLAIPVVPSMEPEVNPLVDTVQTGAVEHRGTDSEGSEWSTGAGH